MRHFLVVCIISVCLLIAESAMVNGQGKPKELIDFESRLQTARDALPVAGNPVVWYNPFVKKWVYVIRAEPKITYDVRKSESIVAPLVGVVEISQTSIGTKAFDSEEQARAYQPDPPPTSPVYNSMVTVRFSYIEGKWTASSARRESRVDINGKPAGSPMVFDFSTEDLLKPSGSDVARFIRRFVGLSAE